MEEDSLGQEVITVFQLPLQMGLNSYFIWDNFPEQKWVDHHWNSI